MPEQLRCIIADDNEIDRLTTLSFARQYPFLLIAGVYDSAAALLNSNEAAAAEVMLLDIDMPGVSGLDLRRQLQHVPACIFITSYADYAVDSFEVSALDFLVKPVNGERFARAMARLQEYMSLRSKARLFDCNMGGDILFIKDGHQQIKLALTDVLYLEALKDYTRIVTGTKKYSILKSLGNLLQEAEFKSFVRIHRSYAVQRNFVSKIGTNEVWVNETMLPIGRSYKDQLSTIRRE